MTVGRKNSLLTGTDLQQNQAQGGTPICGDWLGERRRRIEARETEQKANHRKKSHKKVLAKVIDPLIVFLLFSAGCRQKHQKTKITT